MKLAEQLIEHCTPENKAEGYGSLMGTTLPLSDLIAPHVGKKIALQEGVDLVLQPGCDRKTFEQGDGSVQISFNGNLPYLVVQKGLVVRPELTSLVLRIGAAAVEAVAYLKLGPMPFPPFTLTIPLRGSN